MNKTLLPIIALFALTLSITSPLAVNRVSADPAQCNNGATPSCAWVPAGPASDSIRYQMYDSDSAELSAMCVGQAATCVPALDTSDVPIGGNDLSPASGCVASSTHVCALQDPRFWVTAPTIQLGQLQLDINNAATFWGITFCNGQDGVIAGAVVCPDAPGAGNIAAACPNAPGGDCSKAAIHVRQGIASLIDKVAFTIADKGAIGPGAATMDNPLTPASAVLHSGSDVGNFNPCTAPVAPATSCTPGLASCGGVACNTVGPYTATVNTAVTPNQLVDQVPPGPGVYNLGGVCSWDLIAGCSPTLPISAFHYANDATDAAGFVMPGTVDFCRAADHFIAAGLATSKNASCELTNESASLANGNILFYGRRSLGRQLLSTGYTTAICELVNLGATTCPQVTLSIITLAQAHQLVFKTGCVTATEAGCNSIGPNTSWQLYAGGFFFPTPTPDNQWAIYDSSFAADLCNRTTPLPAISGSPGLEPGNYDFVCNARHDFWVEQSQFDTTAAAATAALQVAMDIFGNHTFNVVIWTPSVQYAYTKGWQGVTNCPGIGTAQGNFWSLLNMWNPNPANKGPDGNGRIVWGQKDATSSLNVFSFNTVVEADFITEMYDALLTPNCFNPASQIIGWMASSYTVLTSGATGCPTTYSNSRGTFSVGGCVQIQLRGDIPWHDIYNCAATDPVCLGSHTVTASDVKFSYSAFNATGSLITPATQNTIDVVYANTQLPTTLGGTKGQGETETLSLYLHSLNAYALNDIVGIPIIPQRLWVTQTAPKLANGVFAPCTALGTPSCTVDPAFTAGSQSDPVLANKLVGSGPFVCASGPLGVSGTVVGGGCTFDSTGAPTGQAIPIGGSALLRRFANDQGTSPTSLDFNFAYMRSNAKWEQFQWAAFPSGSTVPSNAFTVAIGACKASATNVGGVVNYAACVHYNTLANALGSVSTAGTTANTVSGGGRGQLPANPIPILIQISHWRNNGPSWDFGVPNYGSLAGTQGQPPTLYEDASVLGSYSITSSASTIAIAAGSSGSVTVGLALSGVPDNSFTSPTAITLSTVQSSALTTSGFTSSFTLAPGTPTGSTPLTINVAAGTATGTYTVFVKAQATAINGVATANLPSVTVQISVTV